MSKASKVKVPKEMTRKHLARAEREARQRLWLLIGLTAVLVFAIGLVGYGFLYERVIKLQQPVATVNGKKITTADFQKRVKFARLQLTSQLNQLEAERTQFASDPSLSFLTQQIDQNINSLQAQLQDPQTLGRQVLNSMVDDELIREEAARRSITVSPDEVQTTIEHSYNFYRVPPTPTPVPTASPTPLASPTPTPVPTLSITPTATPAPTDTPEPTATPVTEQAFNTEFNQYLSQLAQTGMTKNDFYNLVEASLLRQKLLDAFGKDVPKSADQVEFRYIAFDTPQGAQDAEARLKSGTTFNDLYNQVEAGKVVSATTTSEPWMLVSDLSQNYTPNVAQVIQSLTLSQTSQIITDTLGSSALIIQLTGHAVQPLTSSQTSVQQQKDFQNWLDSQRNGPGVNLYNNHYLDVIPP